MMRALICLVLALPGLAHAFGTLDGDRSRWLANPTFRIGRLSRDVPADAARAAIRASFNAWNAVQGSTLAFREVNQGGDITVDFSDPWPAEYGRFAAGVTLTSRAGGRISRATIELNQQNFQWTTGGPDPRLTDIQGVTTHEVGHAIGLGHSFRRDATMYWTGGDVELRDLSADDERGLRYLYGAGGEGVLCDQCESNDDCAGAAICLGLEADRAFCGQPCAGGCPANSACFDLRNGGTSCAPLARVCSDDAPVELEVGDYCFGAEQCAGGAQCVPTPDSARCAAEGAAAFGDPCVGDFECANGFCLPLDDQVAVCAAECDPARPRCPGQAPCVETGDAEIPGVCVPPGDVPEGGLCAGADARCGADLICLLESADEGRCRRTCDPFGVCPAGRGCTPLGDDSWLCLPTDGPAAGQPCAANGLCAGGNLCLPVDGGPGICAQVCDPGGQRARCAGGRTCRDFGDGLGLCSPGAGVFETPCDTPLECASFVCVAVDDGGLCSEACARSADCRDGWFCSGGACFPRDEGGAGGAGGAGGS
ncbi:MAG: matrixin family metalloprotease, partial [Myxococcales bacterium]|nr:matrixin family metalloprotease [Myxococcales bacterium]